MFTLYIDVDIDIHIISCQVLFLIISSLKARNFQYERATTRSRQAPAEEHAPPLHQCSYIIAIIIIFAIVVVVVVIIAIIAIIAITIIIIIIIITIIIVIVIIIIIIIITIHTNAPG